MTGWQCGPYTELRMVRSGPLGAHCVIFLLIVRRMIVVVIDVEAV